MDIKGALNRIADGKDLTGTEMRQVMDIIMSGEATASQIGAFLMGMRLKGETLSAKDEKTYQTLTTTISDRLKTMKLNRHPSAVALSNIASCSACAVPQS